MPLIRPEVQKVLRESGLSSKKEKTSESPEGTFTEHLDAAGLTNENIAEQLESIALRSGNEALRLRALETALKVRGALKESAPATPSFTIVIQNGSVTESSQVPGVPSSINPILLPRQLLSTLSAKDKNNHTSIENEESIN